VLFSLTHPNIVRLYDVGTIALASATSTPTPIPYVVLEFINGVPLDQEIALRQSNRGPHFSRDELLTIFDQVLDAMSFAHEHGVTHRDIKPSNIMLIRAQSGIIAKVVDFGIARVTSIVPDASTGAAPFTPRYAAPEQWDPTLGIVGPLSDIFALGLLLVETASLCPALPGQSLTELLNAVMNPQRRLALRPLRPDLPADLETIANLATRTRPEERIRSAKELRSAILTVLKTSQPIQQVQPTLAMHAVQAPTAVYAPTPPLANNTTLQGASTQVATRPNSHTPLILGLVGIIAILILGVVGIGGYFAFRTAHEIADTAKYIPAFPIGFPQPPPDKSTQAPAKANAPAKGLIIVSEISGQDPYWTRAQNRRRSSSPPR
jgi:serine/threonine-protein kinase